MTKVATLVYDNGKFKAMFNGEMLCQSQDKHRVIGLIETGQCAKALERGVSRVEEHPALDMTAAVAKGSPNLASLIPVAKPRPTFTVDERFEMLEDFTDMVINGERKALLVTGDGGLGKSYTVMSRLKRAGLINSMEHSEAADEAGCAIAEMGDYQLIKGKSTARIVFDTLYHNREKMVIYDDCDSALVGNDTQSIMKAALDTTDKRILTWGARAAINGEGSDIPSTFEFRGSVIFISNMRLSNVDQAVRTRCTTMDLSLTTDEKIARMESILTHVAPHIALEHRRAALDFLSAHRHDANNLNIRMIEEIASYRKSYPNTWERKALYSITAG
jgi:hypothetical protein